MKSCFFILLFSSFVRGHLICLLLDMFHLKSSILFLVLCIFPGNLSIGNINELIENRIEDLFLLWTVPCSEWLNVFTSDVVWYHPKFPGGLQYNKLLDFCQLNQDTKPALFRQDGQIRITISGNTSSSSLYHVMVPYVYGQIENGNNNSLFILFLVEKSLANINCLLACLIACLLVCPQRSKKHRF